MTGLTVDVVDPRTDPEPVGWAEFARREPMHAPWDYRLMGIESRAARHPTLLVLVRDATVPVAALTVLRCRTGLGATWMEVHQPWLAGIPGWAFARDLDDTARRDALRAAERAMCRAGGPACLGVLYKHVPHEQRSLVAGRGRVARATVGNTLLTNRFATYEDWLSSLTKKRRYGMRQQFRRTTADTDLVVRFAPARDDVDPVTMAAMLRTHRTKFGPQRYDRRSPMSAEYLRALTARPDVHTLTYHDGAGRLLAFGTLLDHPVMPFDQLWASLEPEAGGRRGLYFDAIRHVVQHMIEHDRATLTAGRGMVELKARYGFAEQPRTVVAVPRIVAG